MKGCNRLTKVSTATEKLHFCTDDRWEVERDIGEGGDASSLIERLTFKDSTPITITPDRKGPNKRLVGSFSEASLISNQISSQSHR